MPEAPKDASSTGTQLPDEVVDEVWQRFRDALMPLHSAGKLGAVLFQFPQWFVISRKTKAYIEECAERLPDFRVAVEFRHKSWMEERNVEETLGFLEERDLPLVCVDMPQGFDSSVPPIAAATAKDLAMVRFHGRNTRPGTSRPRPPPTVPVRLPDEELQEWVPRIEALAGADPRDARADEQLLPRLRGPQRPGARRPARPRPLN